MFTGGASDVCSRALKPQLIAQDVCNLATTNLTLQVNYLTSIAAALA